jgi:hypothetical protein
MMLLRKIRKLAGFAHDLRMADFSSARYWDTRYRQGGNSGHGSYGRLAEFKARVINQYVLEQGIDSVVEFGCGDGNQLGLATYPRYAGYDVSATAVRRCRKIFRSDRSKSFHLAQDYDGRSSDLALSIDVIFHLVEDDVYEAYMSRLFQAAHGHVIIYSSNEEKPVDRASVHVRHRCVTAWVDRHLSASWMLARTVPNEFPYDGDDASTSFANFYIYRKLPGR